METFGEKLRQAVKRRGLTHDLVTMVTHLDLEAIRALERNDLLALPAPEVVEEGLRSLARLLDVDPDEVLTDYRRERERLATEAPHDTRPMAAIVTPDPRRFGTAGVAVPAAAILALAGVAMVFWLRSPAPEPGRPAPAARQTGTTPAAEEALPRLPSSSETAVDSTVPPRHAPARPSDPVEPIPEIDRTSGAAGISIPEYGVGTGVIERELVGETDRFAEEDQVWFWTRIEGGTPGGTIHHVWLHDGKEVLRVPVGVGAARWRTQSYKMMNAGSAGRWVVEARDDAGRVLARREFHCSPRPRS